MKRYILLLVGLFSFSSADSVFFVNTFPVYVIGDASGVADMFNFLGMVLQHGAVQTIIFIGVVIALVRLFIQAGNHDMAGIVKEIVWIIGVFAFFLAPNSSVVVKDGRIDNGVSIDLIKAQEFGYVAMQKVDNVPIGLAVISSFATVVNWEIANLLETAVTPIGLNLGSSVGITRAGFNQPAKDMRWLVTRMSENKNVDTFDLYLAEYVEKCAFPTIDIDPRNATKIMNPPGGDYQTYLSPLHLQVAGTMIVDPLNKKNRYDCAVYWDTFLAGSNAEEYNDKLFASYMEYKTYSGGGEPSNDYNDYLRKIISSEANTEIASFKDTVGALKRAAVVAGALSATGTGLQGIDTSNRMQMTEAKQGMMIQGPASFAWLGEILPQGINIALGFIIAMSALMALFLLYQGWLAGVKVILNYTAGVFALAFTYVSLAVTQGFVNRWSVAEAIKQYKSSGASLQISNYNYLLEQSASMQGMAGLLGVLFVGLGAGIVFYGETKGIVNGLMGKLQSSFGGNDLDKQFKDNIQDTALTDSLQEARRDVMAQRLAEAGIPFDGGNIEYHYAGLQQQISELGAARGAHFGLDSREERDNLYSGAALQSFEKLKGVQGHGAEVTSHTDGSLNADSFSLVEAASFTEGRAGAAELMGKSSRLSNDGDADSFVEGARRGGIIAASKGIGMGKAVPQDENGKPMSMEEYGKAIEEQSALDLIMQGEKALAARRFLHKGIVDGKEAMMAKEELAIGAHRSELGNLGGVMAKGMLFDEGGNQISNDDYLTSAVAGSLQKEMQGYAHGKAVADKFGSDFKNNVTMMPSALPGDISPALKYQDDPIKTSEDEVKNDASSSLNNNLKNSSPERKEKLKSAMEQKSTTFDDVANIVGAKTEEEKEDVKKNLKSSGVDVDKTSGELLYDRGVNSKLNNNAKKGMGDFIDWYGDEIDKNNSISPEEKKGMKSNLSKLKSEIDSANSLKDIPLDSFINAGLTPQLLQGMGFKLLEKDGKFIGVGGIDNKVLGSTRVSDEKSPTQEVPSKDTTQSTNNSETRDDRVVRGNRPPLPSYQRSESSSPIPEISTKDWNNYRAALAKKESGGSGDLRAENQYGFIGRYQFGADALSDTGFIDSSKWAAAKARGVRQKQFLANDSNWKIAGGKAAFMGTDGNSVQVAENHQENALAKLTKQNFNTLKRNGVPVGQNNTDYTTGLLAVSHLLGAGDGIKFAKGGVTSVDGNGTTAATYFELGAHGKIGTNPKNIPNSGVGGLNMAGIAGAYANKDVESWIGGGLAHREAANTDPSIFRQTSYVGELSRTLGSKADIDAKGGIAQAINTSVTDQALRAAKAGVVVEQDVAAIGRANGMSPKEASNFAKDIMDGFRQGTELHKKGILEAAGAAAGIQAGKKTEQDQREAQNFAQKFGSDFAKGTTTDTHEVKKDNNSSGSKSNNISPKDIADDIVEQNKKKNEQKQKDANSFNKEAIKEDISSGMASWLVESFIPKSKRKDGDVKELSEIIANSDGDIESIAKNLGVEEKKLKKALKENNVPTNGTMGYGVSNIDIEGMAQNETVGRVRNQGIEKYDNAIEAVKNDNSLSNYEKQEKIAELENNKESFKRGFTEIKNADGSSSFRMKSGGEFGEQTLYDIDGMASNNAKKIESEITSQEELTPSSGAVIGKVVDRYAAYQSLKTAAEHNIAQGGFSQENFDIVNDKDGKYSNAIIKEGKTLGEVVSGDVLSLANEFLPGAKEKLTNIVDSSGLGALNSSETSSSPKKLFENIDVEQRKTTTSSGEVGVQSNNNVSTNSKLQENPNNLSSNKNQTVDDELFNTAIKSLAKMAPEDQEKGLMALKHAGIIGADSTLENISKVGSEEPRISKTATYSEIAEALAQKSVQSEIGAGIGAINNIAQSPDIYQRNAMYGEMSHAQTSEAKIDTQGGVQRSVGVDVGESALKAASQIGGTKSQIRELARAEGYSGEAADAITKAMLAGGVSAASLIQGGITSAAASLSAGRSGAQAAGDAATIKQFGDGSGVASGVEGFIESGKIEGAKKGVTQKAQNLDLTSPEKAQTAIDDISNQVLHRLGREKGEEMVGKLREVGLVTADSTLDNLEATSGEQYAVAKAHLAAGAMSRSERFAIGDVSLSTVTDVTTGHTRIEAVAGNKFTYGDKVHNEQGFKMDNPVQVAAKELTGLDATNVGTPNESWGDAAMLVGVSGAGALAVVGTATGFKATRAGYGAVKGGFNKIFGKTPVTDVKGNKGYYKASALDGMQDNLEADGKGGFKYKGGSLDDLDKAIDENQRRGSSKYAATNATTPTPTNHNTQLEKNHNTSSNMRNSLLQNIVDSETELTNPNDTTNLGGGQGVDGATSQKTTKSPLGMVLNGEGLGTLSDAELDEVTKQTSQYKAKIDSVNDFDAGKKEAIVRLNAASKENLDLGTIEGNKNSKLADILKEKINTKSNIPLNDADKELFSQLTGDKLPTNQTGDVSFKMLGQQTKKVAYDSLENINKGVVEEQSNRAIKAETSKNSADADAKPKPDGDGGKGNSGGESTTSTDSQTNKGADGDASTKSSADADSSKFDAGAGSKKGKIVSTLLGLGAAAGGYALFSTEAEGATIPSKAFSNIDSSSSSNNITPDASIGTADVVGLGVGASFNALNTYQAASEIKGGAASNLGALTKGANYTVGAKTALAELGDVSLKQGAGKMLMKKLPGIGLGLGAAMGVSRASDGDYMGAAMEFASGALSLIPGIGTAASVAIDSALLARDYQDAKDHANQNAGNLQGEQFTQNSSGIQNENRGVANSASSSGAPAQNSSISRNENQRSQGVTSSPNSILSSDSQSTEANQNVSVVNETSIGQEGLKPTSTTQGTSTQGNSSSANQTPLASPDNKKASTSENITREQRGSNTKALNKVLQSMSDEEAGEHYIETIASNVSPSIKENLARSASVGMLTPRLLESAGVSSEIVSALPVDKNGAVDTVAVGSQYKAGVNNIVGVLEAENSPIQKLSGGISNNLMNSGQSFAAAEAIMSTNTLQAPQSAVTPVSSVAPQQVDTSTTHSQAMQVPQQQSINTPSATTTSTNVGSESQMQSSAVAMQNISDIMNNPGNLHTPNSAIRDSVRDVEGKLANLVQPSPQVMEFNKGSIGDMVSGMATTAPIQTQGGELTLSQMGGNLAFGFGQNAIQSNIPYESFKQFDSGQQEQFLANLASTNLNNGMLASNQSNSSNETNWKPNSQETSEEILSQIKRSGDVGMIDERLYAEEQISYLEDLVEEMESIKEITTGQKVG